MTELLTSDEQTFTSGSGGWTGGSVVSGRYQASGAPTHEFIVAKSGITPGNTIAAGVDVEGDGNTETMRLQLEFYNGANLVDFTSTQVSGGAAQRLTLSFTAPATTDNVKMKVVFFTYDEGPDITVSIDNASLDQSAAAPTGTLAVTLDPSTLAAAGTTTVTGTLAATLNPSTLAASGTTTVTGTLAATLADSTLAASGDVESGSTGTLAVTLDPSTLAASGDAGAPEPPAADITASTGGNWARMISTEPPRGIDDELEAVLASLLLLT